MKTGVDISFVPRIGHCGESRQFSLEEGERMLDMVWRITDLAQRELQPVRENLENMLPCDPRLPAVEAQYESIVRGWMGKLERLGLVVRGLWTADFDTGDGYLCWQFPERRLRFFYGYEEDSSNRRQVDDVIEETMPDWASS